MCIRDRSIRKQFRQRCIDREQRLGKLVYKCIRKLENITDPVCTSQTEIVTLKKKSIINDYWIVYIYKQFDRYIFELVNYKNKNKKLQKVYYHSEASLLNTQQKPLVKFMVEQIEIHNYSYVNFRFQQFQEIDIEKQTQEKELNQGRENSKGNENQRGGGNDTSSLQKTVQTEVNEHQKSNMVNYSEELDQSNNIQYIYNVTYNKSKQNSNTIQQGKVQQQTQQQQQQMQNTLTQLQFQPSQQQLSQQQQQLMQQENQQNQMKVIQVDVPLKSMKQMYPSLEITNIELMKRISSDLVQGIKVSKFGKIQLDVTKIQQTCIKLQSNETDQGNFMGKNQSIVSLTEIPKEKQLIQEQVQNSIQTRKQSLKMEGQQQIKEQAVSYTHLTLPTICSVQISVVAVSLKKKKKYKQRRTKRENIKKTLYR
eukprot:TRINITY_DN6880_c0_g1_i4.p1 TRINITY_DN6880_c0_g1~~TRINITY_DN6880_c0_g1_i4.p1  ORF type:complete len:424 (+),score=81.92 TRINITY_DN6880_c0_g1_i4:191-1462(+)